MSVYSFTATDSGAIRIIANGQERAIPKSRVVELREDPNDDLVIIVDLDNAGSGDYKLNVRDDAVTVGANAHAKGTISRDDLLAEMRNSTVFFDADTTPGGGQFSSDEVTKIKAIIEAYNTTL